MKKYKIVVRAIFAERVLKAFPKKRKYMQRTFYYKAHSKEHALAKLAINHGIEDKHGSTNTWIWNIVSVEEVIEGQE